MASSIRNFRAETGSEPNQIKLFWSLSENLLPTERVRIRRSESVYPLVTEGVQVYETASSTINFFLDESLQPDTFYYYTVFIFDTGTSTYRDFEKLGQAFALSYRNWGEGDRLYSLFPLNFQLVDTQRGLILQKLSKVIGNMMDFYRSFVTTQGFFRNPDKAPENILDFYSLMFGFAPERGFDLRVLRNVALGIISVYKKKGTCPGLVEFVKLFTTWDSQCDDTVDLTFRWWDPDTKRHLSYLTGVATNKAIDANASFTPDLWQNGKFVDPLDDPFYEVVGNTTTEILFSTKTPPFTRDTGTSGIGTSSVTFQDLSKSWTVDQWRGHRLYIDSFSSEEYFTIISNTTNELTLNPKKTNFGTPEVYQDVGLDMVAPSVISYRIEPEYYVQQGRHSLTYDNTVPPGFRGSTKDPAHFYVGGNRSLLSLGQFSDLAVLVIITGVADFSGRSTALTQTVLTDTNADFGPVNSLVGKSLNPNVLQANDFTILSNTGTTITVLGDMTEVAATANNYYVLDASESVRAKRLREVLPEFAPRDVEIFLFFDAS